MNFFKDKEARKKIKDLEQQVSDLSARLAISTSNYNGYSIEFFDAIKNQNQFNEIYEFLGVERVDQPMKKIVKKKGK